MKEYQDTETGKIWAFKDNENPLELNNRHIPKTLSERVIRQPSENHVWLNGRWIEKDTAPKGYVTPISSVPAYNPAWISFLFPPYTVVLPDTEKEFHIPMDQAINKSYDGERLSEVVTTFSLSSSSQLSALISFDGSVAIPRNSDYPSPESAIDAFNRIFCAILLGGTHAEAIDLRGLVCGSLESSKSIFINNPTLHGRMRCKEISVQELLSLVHPRMVRAADLKNSYIDGLKVLDALNSFSPIFLLRGYSASLYNNPTDSLSNLWIVVEQLTSVLWKDRFILNQSFHPPAMNGRVKSFADNRTWSTAVKHELLWQTKSLTAESYVALSSARKARNDLAHQGIAPTMGVINCLWAAIFELFEVAAQISVLGMRNLKTFVETPTAKLVFDIHTPAKDLDFNHQGLVNFDEWASLSGDGPGHTPARDSEP